MDVEDIDEPVKVGAVFSGAKVVPKWFLRRGVKYKVDAVHMTRARRRLLEVILDRALEVADVSSESVLN